MVLKLYGNSSFAASQRVATVLLEKQVPFELIEVDFANGEHKSPEYLTKHPFGQTPYIDDDGFILYESRAICRYISTKYADQGTSLLPTDLKENALFEQAASIELSNFDPLVLAAVVEGLYKPRFRGIATDPVVFEEHVKNLGAKLDAYDIILSKQQHLAGDKITLADLFHLANGSILAAIGCDIMETRPNVARWWKEISSRPSWVSTRAGIKSTV